MGIHQNQFRHILLQQLLVSTDSLRLFVRSKNFIPAEFQRDLLRNGNISFLLKIQYCFVTARIDEFLHILHAPDISRPDNIHFRRGTDFLNDIQRFFMSRILTNYIFMSCTCMNSFLVNHSLIFTSCIFTSRNFMHGISMSRTFVNCIFMRCVFMHGISMSRIIMHGIFMSCIFINGIRSIFRIHTGHVKYNQSIRIILII